MLSNFFFFFLVRLRFEFRALCLQNRVSTSLAMPPVLLSDFCVLSKLPDAHICLPSSVELWVPIFPISRCSLLWRPAHCLKHELQFFFPFVFLFYAFSCLLVYFMQNFVFMWSNLLNFCNFWISSHNLEVFLSLWFERNSSWFFPELLRVFFYIQLWWIWNLS
jgi:hypothetical protein